MRHYLYFFFCALLLFGCFSLPVKSEEPLTVAVVDFTNNGEEHLRNVGQSASEILSVMLVQTGKFNVVERDKLRAIVIEHGLAESGLVDLNESAIQVGRFLGADFLITGSVVSYEERIVKFTGYGLNTKKTIGEMTVSVKVLNVNSGKIEFASLYTSQVDEGKGGALQTESSDMTRPLLFQALQAATNQLVESISLETETEETVELVLSLFRTAPRWRLMGFIMGALRFPSKSGQVSMR